VRNFLNLVGRFGADERGVFGVIFAVMAIVIVAFSGAVVDYVSVQQAKTRAQVALDAAALALQPKIYTQTEEQIKTAADQLLVERLADPTITAKVSSATYDTTNGSLDLRASVTVNTNFVRLVGVNTLTAGLLSEATRKKLNLEVAMVLDNSGSMADNQNNYARRLTRLKEAARCAADILLSGDETCPSGNTAVGATNVKDTWIGIVTFNAFVNVGPQYTTATWMDTTGKSRIARDNFDNDDNEDTPFTGPVNRFDLYNNLKGVTWKGCVEARSHNGDYDVTDKPPSQSAPDSLFVPVFAPDEPSSWGSSANSYIPDSPPSCPQSPSCVQLQTKTQCSTRGNNKSNYDKASCSGPTTTSWIFTETDGTSKTVSSCPAVLSNGSRAVTSDAYEYTSVGNNNYTNYWRQTYSYPFSDRVLQERLCKYNGATVDTSKSGPNGSCVATPLLPLTSDKSSIISRINSMVASGNTNIAQGAVWGWHLLSENEPFKALPYDSGSNSKVMILMTDGDNTSNYNGNMNLSTLYAAYGYPWNDRPSGAPSNSRLWGNPSNTTTNLTRLQDEMNARTLSTCTNAKAAGIKIYTIGLSSTNATTIQMLKDCSNGDGYWYFPATSDALKDTFKQIASQLASLRLAK